MPSLHSLLSSISCFGSLCLLLTSTSLNAQPVFGERYEVGGVLFYPDLKVFGLHYHLPLNICGSERPDGSPDFLLVRTVAHREAEISTTGILQFTLKRERMGDAELLRLARSHYPSVQRLRALPITGFHLSLTDGRQRIGTLGVPAGDLAGGRSVDLGHWREQTFTVGLTPEAATLLVRQKDSTGRIGFNLSYEIRADFVIRRIAPLEVNGTAGQTELDSLLTDPSVRSTNRVARSGAIKFETDVERWGDHCYREIVVNHQSIPRYLPFSVSCYDFSQGLRPDLEAKFFRICGTGLAGGEVCRDLEFSAESPALEAVTVSFPGPVLSNHPLRYWVSEIDLRGNEKRTEWQTMPPGKHLDITTPLAERFLARRTVDVYANPMELRAAGYTSAALLIEYKLLGEEHRLELEIGEEDELGFRTASFHYDDRESVNQSTWYVLPDGDKTEATRSALISTAINLNPQQ